MTRAQKATADDAPGASRGDLERRIEALEEDVVAALLSGNSTAEIRDRLAELQFNLAAALHAESAAVLERILRSAGDTGRRAEQLSAASAARLRHLLDDLAPPPAPAAGHRAAP